MRIDSKLTKERVRSPSDAAVGFSNLKFTFGSQVEFMVGGGRGSKKVRNPWYRMYGNLHRISISSSLGLPVQAHITFVNVVFGVW